MPKAKPFSKLLLCAALLFGNGGCMMAALSLVRGHGSDKTTEPKVEEKRQKKRSTTRSTGSTRRSITTRRKSSERGWVSNDFSYFGGLNFSRIDISNHAKSLGPTAVRDATASSSLTSRSPQCVLSTRVRPSTPRK